MNTALSLIGHGFDSGGDTYEPMGSILIWAPLAGHSSGSTPGEISFWTTPEGSVIQGIRMIISDSGNLGINVGFFPSERLHVGGNILSTGEVTALSGTFTDSLTISGVPAATGISISQTDLDGKVDETGDTMTGQLIFDTRTVGSGVHFLSSDGASEVGQIGLAGFDALKIDMRANVGTLGFIDMLPKSGNFGVIVRDHTGLGSDWTNFATVTGGGLTYHSISVNAGANVLGLIIDDNDNVGVGVVPDSSVDLDVLGDARIQSQLGIATLPNAAVQLDISGDARISNQLGVGKLPATSIALDVIGDAVVSNDLVASGSVGIGTNPVGGLALDVAGDTSIDGNLFVNADSLVDEVQLTVRATTDQESNIFVVEDASAVDIFTVSGTAITATVGDAQIGISVLEFYSATDLKYSLGWDAAQGALILASGTLGNENDMVRFSTASGIEGLAQLSLPSLPIASGGLNSGDVWVDESADYALKVTP